MNLLRSRFVDLFIFVVLKTLKLSFKKCIYRHSEHNKASTISLHSNKEHFPSQNLWSTHTIKIKIEKQHNRPGNTHHFYLGGGELFL